LKLLLLAFLSASALFAQHENPSGKGLPVEPRFVVRHDGDDLVFSAENGAVGLDELTRRWSETTGRNFTYSPQIVRGPVLLLTGSVQTKKADADFVFESLLVRAGFALTAVGPPESKLFAVEPIDGARSLKQNAPFVATDGVQALARMPAQLFTTAFVLKNANASAARNSLQQLLVHRNTELSTEIISTNTLVVTTFGPTLASIQNVLASIDRAPGPSTTAIETIALKYGVATEVAAVVDALMRAKESPAKPMPQSPEASWQVEKVETRIVADVRTNSIIVQGSEDVVATVKRLVAVLDAPAGEKAK
jgi:type II secretory pathway component GspD/PulD (secretin)